MHTNFIGNAAVNTTIKYRNLMSTPNCTLGTMQMVLKVRILPSLPILIYPIDVMEAYNPVKVKEGGQYSYRVPFIAPMV